MAAKRLAALVGAVLLIVGAVVLRGFLDDGGSVAVGREGAPVVCDPLVIEACKLAFPDVEVTEEQPGVTLDRLLDERNPEPFVWVTAQVWFDILGEVSPRPTPIMSASVAVASSDRVIAFPTERPICPEPAVAEKVLWSCLSSADAATLDLGFDGPDSTLGLLMWGDLTAAYFKGVDRQAADIATNDFDADFKRWRAGIDDRLKRASSIAAVDVLVTRQGELDVATTVGAEWSGDGRQAGYTAVTPVDGEQGVVIGAGAIGDARIETDDLAARLVEQGWEPAAPDSTRPADAVPPGVLQALRQL